MADSLIERSAVAIHHTCTTPGSYPADPRNPRSVYGRAARWLATLGLLADPEQNDEHADRQQFLGDVVADRDALQARIDEALEWLADAEGMELTRVGIEAIRSRLRGPA